MESIQNQKHMDFKSILIGGLGTALLFVSLGASVQSEPTTIQVTENPFPYEVVSFNMVGSASPSKALLNRETGDLEYINAGYDSKNSAYILKTFDFKRHD